MQKFPYPSRAPGPVPACLHLRERPRQQSHRPVAGVETARVVLAASHGYGRPHWSANGRFHGRVGHSADGRLDRGRACGGSRPRSSSSATRAGAHKLRTGRQGGDLVFARTAGLPFTASTVRTRAHKAWNAAGLEPLTPHEARGALRGVVLHRRWLQCEADRRLHRTRQRQADLEPVRPLIPGDEVTAAAQLDAFFATSPPRASGL